MQPVTNNPNYLKTNASKSKDWMKNFHPNPRIHDDSSKPPRLWYMYDSYKDSINLIYWRHA